MWYVFDFDEYNMGVNKRERLGVNYPSLVIVVECNYEIEQCIYESCKRKKPYCVGFTAVQVHFKSYLA